MQRKRIAYEETIEVSFSARDAELVRDHTFADPEYVERLKPKPGSGGGLVGKFTLDDLDDLLGYIAAEANHSKSKKLQKELDGLHDRLQRVMNSYDDGG
ncbi:MAG TPA: hypothetical protein VGL70_10550 [Candidatus Binatia bacterium]